MSGKNKAQLSSQVNRDTNSSRIHILEYQNRRFIVGLQWETVRASRNLMKEVRRIGRERKLDVVAIRKSDSVQAGFAPRTKKKLRGGYSLIVTLASLLEGCCIAVISLGKNENKENIFTLMGKTEKGGIHPFSDEIYTESQLSQVVIDLKSDLRGSITGTDIPVYGDTDQLPFVSDAIDLDSLLNPKNLSKDFRLKPLTWGMTKNQLLISAAGAVIAIGVMVLLNEYYVQQEENQRLIRVAKEKQAEEINRLARYKTALDKLKHPWIKTPSVSAFIDSCSLLSEQLPLSVAGWLTSSVECGREDLRVTLVRPENSATTTKEAVKTVRDRFGSDAEFFFNQTSVITFSIRNPVAANGDDPLIDSGEQLIKIISLFQGVNINAMLTAVEIKDVSKNDLGEDMPLQDWQEYKFDVETVIPPQLIFTGDEFNGIRLNKIIYTIENDSSTVRYKIEGSLYGTR